MVATRRTSKISGNGSLSIVETRASKRTRHSLTPAPDSPVDVLVAPASEPTEEKKQIRTKQLRSSTVKKKKVVKQTAPILSLTDKLLLDIFTLIAVPENQQASQAYCREILPLVCKRWHHLLQLPSDVWKVRLSILNLFNYIICHAAPSHISLSPGHHYQLHGEEY